MFKRMKLPRAASLNGRIIFVLPPKASRTYVTQNIRVQKPPSPQYSELLAKFLAQAPRPLSIPKLLSFGRPLSPESLLASATYVLSEAPRRLARRIRALESLPFIVGTNPYIAHTLEIHRRSIEWLATQPGVTTLEENAKFSAQLDQLVHRHSNDVPTIAKGFQECRRYMSQESMTEFLDHAIRNRISVRLLAEQHIALTWALEDSSTTTYHSGVVNMECSPSEMIHRCSSIVSEMCDAMFGASPRVVIDGRVDATFAYVPNHLQYIMTELLKNAFRATMEKHGKSYGMVSSDSLPPVIVTISPFSRNNDPELPSYVSLRIRDEGGGISSSYMPHIFAYAFTTAGRDQDASDHDETQGGPYAAQTVGGSAALGGETTGEAGEANLFTELTSKGVQTGVGTLAGLGYGLPMSRLYARYFGGSLDLYSLDGWGTDAVLKLRNLSQAVDKIEI